MIRDDAKIIVIPTGVSLKEALTKEVVKELSKEASNYINYDIPEVKLIESQTFIKIGRINNE